MMRMEFAIRIAEALEIASDVARKLIEAGVNVKPNLSLPAASTQSDCTIVVAE
jgi:hypothetical protein